jgi:hypothetical protein
MSDKVKRRGIIEMGARRRKQPARPAPVLDYQNAAHRLLFRLVATGLIRPRRRDLWTIVRQIPPGGPRAS